jgi:hypothetical protein
VPATVTWRSSIASSSALHFRGRAIDFVPKNDIGKQWSRLEIEFTASTGLNVDFGSGDVRWQEVRRELNSAEVGFQVCREGFDCPGFSETRQTFNQQIAVCQQTNDKSFNDPLLADDRAAHTIN